MVDMVGVAGAAIVARTHGADDSKMLVAAAMDAICVVLVRRKHMFVECVADLVSMVAAIGGSNR
ncbi:hypothetical protein DEO72_LG10g423 [Vigna unguiculata]|uniref:Uncharacterized protein n=1 Tax=Vigna unguiculata TaxID=3917 RepID=A0A4D6N8T1_VIGUN|nr:hypothetical protein DEO72_LG10g423 [Vigna unguiculata]